MPKISGSTFYYKRIFPVFWFGTLLFIFSTSIFSGNLIDSPMIIVAPLIMATFGYFLFKRLVWDLADEVYDNGNELIFHKGKKTQTVKLSEIININSTSMSAPERVTISVRKAGEIGNELVFSLPIRLNTFTKNPLIRELIERVDRAKNT